MENPVQPESPAVLTDAQVEALARDTAQPGLVYHFNDGEKDYDLDLSQYPESEIERVNQRRAEIEAEAAAENTAPESVAPGDVVINFLQEVLPDRVDTVNYGQTIVDPSGDEGDGYTLVDTVTYAEETKIVPLADLQEKVVVEYDERAQRGVGAAFNRHHDGSGSVTLRIIADHNSRAALSRKDEAGVTHLKVHFRHQDA